MTTGAGSGDASAPTAAELLLLEEATRGAAGARLHDEAVQDMLATRYLADIALSAAARNADATTLTAHLESIREAAAAALAAGRRQMSDLTARATDGRGLSGALRTVAAAYGDAVVLHTGDAADPELGDLPPAVAVVVHRLVAALLAAVTPASGPLRVEVRREGTRLLVVHVGAAGRSDMASLANSVEELKGWLRRADALGARVVQDGASVTAEFPLATGKVV